MTPPKDFLAYPPLPISFTNSPTTVVNQQTFTPPVLLIPSSSSAFALYAPSHRTSNTSTSSSPRQWETLHQNTPRNTPSPSLKKEQTEKELVSVTQDVNTIAKVTIGTIHPIPADSEASEPSVSGPPPKRQKR